MILARLDRLSARARDVAHRRRPCSAGSFALPLLEGVLGEERSGDAAPRAAAARPDPAEPPLAAAGVPVQARADPGDGVPHAARRRARAGCTGEAAEWLEERYADRDDEVLGLLAHHWLAAAETRTRPPTTCTRAGDKARQEYALDEAIGHYRELLPLLERRGERQEIALVLFKLALALHMSLRFAEANDTYQRAFAHWTPPEPPRRRPRRLRVATSFLPNDPDPKSAIAWPNIQLCMQLFDRLVEAWPERTIVPSLAERWEISDDGLRYVFHLRDGLTLVRRRRRSPRTTSSSASSACSTPTAPGSSVAIYFVLENGQDYYLGRNDDADAIGVRALDDRTVEFRLVAPAPYFMSVMNRPDGGPQPRHAIERDGDALDGAGRQVVSGPFEVARADRATRSSCERRADDATPRRGNVARGRARTERRSPTRCRQYERGETDLIAVRYTPRLADLMPGAVRPRRGARPGGVVRRTSASTTRILSPANLDLRRALAHAIDRDALAAACPANLVVATGGVVPPALQGHTPGHRAALRPRPRARVTSRDRASRATSSSPG